MSWATDVKTALRFENNLTDETGSYTWTNSGGVPFSSSIFYEGAYSIGLFSSSKNINASLMEDISTIDFWIYVSTANGTMLSLDSISAKLYFNSSDQKLYYNHDNVGQIGGFSVPLNQWIRLQLTWDGQYETIYFNGAEMAEQQFGFYPTGLVRIGNNETTDDPFVGYVDFLKISNINYVGAEILPLPELTLLIVSPNSGTESGGTLVTLTGLLFTNVTDVFFGSNQATDIVIVDDKNITCITPAGTAGEYVDVEVYIDVSHTATITAGFLYTAVVVVPGGPDVGGAEMIIEKENLVLAATITPTSAAVQDGKHTHFNVDTGAANYYKLAAGQTITVDFGSAKTIKKITLYLYPLSKSYYINEASYNNPVAKIEWFNGSTWNNLTWASFNQYYGLPAANLYYTASYYAATVGLISVWDRTGISASKIRITAPGVNIGITEIEACDLIITEPTNIRVNETSDPLGVYQGISISGTIIDYDYSVYLGVEYRRNAFLKATFKDQVKYFGQLLIDGITVDEQNFITFIECVNLYNRMAETIVNKNADIGMATAQDYAQVIEWLFACADIYRDLFIVSVILTGFNYFPENTDVQSELAAVIESGGDIQLLCQDGLLAVKSRTQEASTTATVAAQGDNWTPPCSLFAADFTALSPDKLAPIFGFSIAETYDISFAAWRNGWLIDSGPTTGRAWIAGADDNHYNLRLTTTTAESSSALLLHAPGGYWRMRGALKTITYYDPRGATYYYWQYFCGQYCVPAGQGTVYVTVRIAPTDINHLDTTTLDTSAGRLRVIYYIWYEQSTSILWQGKKVFNETTQTTVSDNSKTFGLKNGMYSGTTFDIQFESYNNNGATVLIEGIGISGIYPRSAVLEASTPDAITFQTLSLSISSPAIPAFNIFTLSENDSEPVLSASYKIGSVAGNTLKVFLVPTSTAMQILTYNFNTTTGYPQTIASATWTLITLNSNLKINYLETVSADIENGTIQVYPKDLKYKKGARNVDEDIIYNRLKIDINKYAIPAAAESIYDDETPFVIHTTAYSFVSQNTALNLAKTTNLYINVIVGGTTYEYNYTPGTYYNTVMDCDIVFTAYVLGCAVSISPRTTFDRNIQIIKITGYPYDNTGKITDIKDFTSSQQTYGIIEKDISNSKVNTEAQSLLIQKKYERFLTLPALFLADGATCDLILAVDLAKYVLISDERIYNALGQYKIYEYEIEMDISNNLYELIVKGREQNYSQY